MERECGSCNTSREIKSLYFMKITDNIVESRVYSFIINLNDVKIDSNSCMANDNNV